MDYQPIANYGVIGNMRTVALVANNGSIDWYCHPHFDSPSVFAAILDANKGGHFRINPVGDDVTLKQAYWPDTNVLITRFLSDNGVGEILDYIPIGAPRDGMGFHGLIRRVRATRGTMKFRMECRPAFNYAQDRHEVEIVHGGAKFLSSLLDLALASDVSLVRDGDSAAAEFTLEEGQSASFELHDLESSGRHGQIGLTGQESEQLFRDTIQYWRNWLSKCTYHGRWREMVHRSALVLKLLTFEPTGAIIAAPTCSLPESPGGSRNWDYRYTWIRDAAFSLYSLLRIGFVEEATQFMSFLDARCHEMAPDGSLQVVYGIDGRHNLDEVTLDHLEGYRGSRPVRVGNAAETQLQLDLYGELMDSVYLYNKHGSQISYDLWVYLRRLLNWVCDHWQVEDETIWEVRDGKREFVFSKLMCWVAVDRALRLADNRSFPADRTRWTQVRDEIYEDIMARGWNAERGTFVQSYGSDALDASSLMMPLVFFVSPTDPRMLHTIDAINRSPKQGGLVSAGMVFRYDLEKTPGGLKGTEGTCTVCTFWLVEALTRAARHDTTRLDEARLLFEQILSHANHLGLYSEEIGHTGEALGNFPQGLSHLSLISAAVNLDQWLDGIWGGGLE